MRPSIDPNAIYTLKETGQLLSLSRNTLMRLLARGELNGAKLDARTWRIKGSDLLDFYERKKQQTGTEKRTQ